MQVSSEHSQVVEVYEEVQNGETQSNSEHPQVVEVYEEVQNGETQSNSCTQLFVFIMDLVNSTRDTKDRGTL